MTTSSTTAEPDRVTEGTIYDLPNPLARAYGMAMLLGLKIELLKPEGDSGDFLAALTLDVDDRGIRDVALICDALDDNTKAEAIFFVLSIVACNREMGLDLSPWCGDVDGRPFVGVTTERVTPEKAGFGRLAVEMSRSAGIADPTAFVIADPSEAPGGVHGLNDTMETQ
ncbi:hypothetical protein [Nocardioides humi]|uniref:Uncharacterized protein n=1 Tax=Nocardioides humi TaxID=449461 RepID=A0ABN2BMY6_9ACTN|nr:hypothetical protein [Nocardioides humi]